MAQRDHAMVNWRREQNARVVAKPRSDVAFGSPALAPTQPYATTSSAAFVVRPGVGMAAPPASGNEPAADVQKTQAPLRFGERMLHK